MAHPDVTPDQLRSRLSSGEALYLLDVREPAEVDDWAFPGAVNIPLGELPGRAGELPTDRSIVVVCHSGVRSAAAANALDGAGYRAENLTGGAVAWIATEPNT